VDIGYGHEVYPLTLCVAFTRLFYSQGVELPITRTLSQDLDST